eukprot:tig00000133_g7719.t1
MVSSATHGRQGSSVLRPRALLVKGQLAWAAGDARAAALHWTDAAELASRLLMPEDLALAYFHLARRAGPRTGPSPPSVPTAPGALRGHRQLLALRSGDDGDPRGGRRRRRCRRRRLRPRRVVVGGVCESAAAAAGLGQHVAPPHPAAAASSSSPPPAPAGAGLAGGQRQQLRGDLGARSRAAWGSPAPGPNPAPASLDPGPPAVLSAPVSQSGSALSDGSAQGPPPPPEPAPAPAVQMRS